MFFRSTALLMATTAAVAAGKSVEIPMGKVSADSKLGQKIMSKARRLDQNNNQQVGYWVSKYSLVFEKCGYSSEYYAFEGEGGNNGNGGYMAGQQMLAHFKLCPSDGSSTTQCGNYAVPLGQFMEYYNQAKMDAIEYQCEMTKNYCYCDNNNGNNNEEYCLYQCYQKAGLEGMCEDGNNNNQNNGGYEFDLERASRCDKMEGVDEDQVAYYLQQEGAYTNYYGGEMGLFIGPTCSADGKSVYLDTFTDEGCTNKAPKDAFSKFSYGMSLPYSQSSRQSMIDHNYISCKEPQDANDQNQNDQNDADDILEVCERTYEMAAKCEDKLPEGTTYYANTYGCNLINSIKVSKTKSRSSHSGSATGVFLGLFVIATVAFAGVAYHFYQKSERSNVNLTESTGEAAMA